VLSQTGEYNSLPNQLIVAVLLQVLLNAQSVQLQAERVRLVSQDRNICSLFKLELSKVYAEDKNRTSLEFERVKLYEIENEILY